ncbi:hypothetical protein H5410_021599 [Solanum commersonii]|uniref:Uncharacterized protein n=1 Tax=Solanum commersonii TaxID=4109 RepID=A0A9J5ZHP1_SOLCO|nr:hypothetical protein H5410_021599 [Solanum commersonii]
MSRVASDGAAMPDPLGADVDISVDNVWIAGCTTASIRSGNLCCYQLLIGLCIQLCMCCTIPLHISDGLRNIFIIFILYNRHLRGFPLSSLTNHNLHYQGINKSLKGGLEFGVGEGVSIDNESTLTSG